MKGGAREQALDLVKRYAQPLEFYFGVLLVLGIVYVGQIPDSMAYQANTLLGRLFLFGITLFVADTYSWVYALLMALFTVLVIANAPRTKPRADGFSDYVSDDIDMKMISEPNRWWVERVLRENPIAIEEDRVHTKAIQDNSNSSNSTTSSR